jgi:hypothetical protein
LEAESNRLKAAAASGKDDEAEWLEDEAERLTDEAGKLQQEAEDLKSKADQLDVEADRIDRIEDDRYAADAADRQSRIDKDLDNDGVAYDYEDEAEEEPAARSKGPLSVSPLSIFHLSRLSSCAPIFSRKLFSRRTAIMQLHSYPRFCISDRSP